MTPSEARSSPAFRELERQAKEAQDRVDLITKTIYREFPLDDGGYWCLMANGKFGVFYSSNPTEDN